MYGSESWSFNKGTRKLFGRHICIHVCYVKSLSSAGVRPPDNWSAVWFPSTLIFYNYLASSDFVWPHVLPWSTCCFKVLLWEPEVRQSRPSSNHPEVSSWMWDRLTGGPTWDRYAELKGMACYITSSHQLARWLTDWQCLCVHVHTHLAYCILYCKLEGNWLTCVEASPILSIIIFSCDWLVANSYLHVKSKWINLVND